MEPAELTSRANVVRATRLEAEHLDLYAVDRTQRINLIRDEAAALRIGGGRVEARDHEDPHAPFVTARSGSVTPAGGRSQPLRNQQGGKRCTELSDTCTPWHCDCARSAGRG